MATHPCLFTVPWNRTFFRNLLDDARIGQFWNGYDAETTRGDKAFQFFLRGSLWQVEVRVHPAYSLIVLHLDPCPMLECMVYYSTLDDYLSTVAERSGMNKWDVRATYTRIIDWDIRPMDFVTVINAIPWHLTTAHERGILRARGSEPKDKDVPPMEPESQYGIARCLFGFTRMFHVSNYSTVPPHDVEDAKDAILAACMARDAKTLRELLGRGKVPHQSAYDVCLGNKDKVCLFEIAKVLRPTGEQLYAMASLLPKEDFLRVHAAGRSAKKRVE